MKLCRFDDNRLGLIEDETITDVTAALSALPPLSWPVPHGDHLVRNFASIGDQLRAEAKAGPKRPLSGVRLLSPIANPSKIIAAPVNYAAHLAEARADKGVNFGSEIKTIDHYGLFLKSTTSVNGTGEGIVLPPLDRRIDHEVEVCIVIGTECHRISGARAMDHVFGYCIGLDMSVRGTEDRSWRKSYDTFTILGPWVVTSDEIRDPANLNLAIEVNGERRQAANTSALIFDIPKLISYASHGYRLYPGDIIMTGTPEGVGPVRAGDVLKSVVTDIGEMTTHVRQAH
jgi:2-keto-4-pentenoate hydratase/2-oxohepta-3-ene-1,7-dioic acid hydratase in catechol pathway